jgi:hypothetical protein
VSEVNLSKWSLIVVTTTVVLVGSGCGSSLREVRAREPEFQVNGVPLAGQLEAARCIRDKVDERVGLLFSILQEVWQESDGVHVIGRSANSSVALFDIAVREDAVAVMVAPGPVPPSGALRDAVVACVGSSLGGPKRQ